MGLSINVDNISQLLPFPICTYHVENDLGHNTTIGCATQHMSFASSKKNADSHSLYRKNFSDSNSDGSFTESDSNSFFSYYCFIFKSLREFSKSSRKQKFWEICLFYQENVCVCIH